MTVHHITVSTEKLAYTLDEVVEMSGVGRSTLYEHHLATGNLTARYASRRPVFLAEDVRAWIASLPTEPPGKDTA